MQTKYRLGRGTHPIKTSILDGGVRKPVTLIFTPEFLDGGRELWWRDLVILWYVQRYRFIPPRHVHSLLTAAAHPGEDEHSFDNVLKRCRFAQLWASRNPGR